MWMAGMGAATVGQAQASAATSQAARAASATESLASRVKDLEHQVGRISLLNQALWELLRERANLTDADLERVANEVDLRDGVADGQITAQPVRCPNCNRVSNSKHYRCLYCGQLFEKPLFG